MAALEDSKKEKYAQGIAAGMTQRQAFLASHPRSTRWNERTVDNNASKLFNTKEIQERIEELKQAAADAAILTRKERMVMLSEIAKDKKKIDKSRLQAIDILNKMDGDYVKRVEAVVTTPIAEVAAKIADILADE